MCEIWAEMFDSVLDPVHPETKATDTYEPPEHEEEIRRLLPNSANGLEIAGVVQMLDLAGIPALAEQRDARHPLVLCGGPLTNSNPLPLAPFAELGIPYPGVEGAQCVTISGVDLETSLQVLLDANDITIFVDGSGDARQAKAVVVVPGAPVAAHLFRRPRLRRPAAVRRHLRT